MKSLKEKLTDVVSEIFVICGYEGHCGVVIDSNRPDLCQYQCNGALIAAAQNDIMPAGVAKQIVAFLTDCDMFQSVVVASPGFINLTINDNFLVEHLIEMFTCEKLGVESRFPLQTIIIDYGGANIAKPLRVTNLKSAFIGESLKRIARFLGNNVLSDIHLGDWGLQVGMVIAEIECCHPTLPYFNPNHIGAYPYTTSLDLTDFEKIHLSVNERAKTDIRVVQAGKKAACALQRGDPGYKALWQHIRDLSVNDLRSDYNDMNIEFDFWHGESDTQSKISNMIDRLKRDGWAFESQGALIIDVDKPNDKRKIPPVVLVKPDGIISYTATDLATIEQRIQNYNPDTIIYVVDKRQTEHFCQVFRCVYQTGIASEFLKLEHIAFGTLNGSDGKPYSAGFGRKLKLKEQLQMITDLVLVKMAAIDFFNGYSDSEKAAIAKTIGIFALKFATLKNHYSKDFVYDLDRFLSFDGYTGPYIFCVCIRIKSILSRAFEEKIEFGQLLLPPRSSIERALMLKLAALPDLINLAYEKRAPNCLCEYAYQLASQLTTLYHNHHLISEKDNLQLSSSLTLMYFSLKAIELVLELLGIDQVDRMRYF